MSLFLRFVLCFLVASIFLGCTSSETPSVSSSEGDVGGSEEDVPEVLLEPFDPPPLEELESKVEWMSQRVVDPIDLLREHKAKSKPEITVEEALSMRNESMEDNAKILSALGQLPDTEDDVDYGAKIVRHAGGDLKSTNPLLINSTIEFDYQGLCAVELFGFDWEMQPLANKDYVVSWQASKDLMYDKVVIRNDLTWSDGQPVTAHDVAFSFQTIMNPKVPVWAVRSGTDQLRWVHAYDDHTLVYFHKQPLATNVWNINFPIIPKHVYEESIKEDPTMQQSEYHIKLENNPVTGGAYQVLKRERGREIVLKRREDFYMHEGQQVRRKPYFEEVRFRVIEDPNTALLALKKGDLHEMSVTADQWQTQTDDAEFYKHNTRATATEWVSFHFGWNNKTPFFEDKRVRRAMSYAFDHEEMLEKIFYGLYEPSTGIYHPTAWMASPKPKAFKQDLDKAEELLDEAGWDDSNGDGIRDKMVNGQLLDFEFSMICGQSPNSIKVCTLLKESLDQIGIICNVRPLEYTVLQQKQKDHQFHATMGGWGTGTDPDTGENLWKSGEERNFVQYANKEIDELFKKGKGVFDPEERAEIYARIHEILWEDQPYTWLFYRNSFYGFNKKLRGYTFSPRGPYNYNPGFNSIWAAAN